MVFSISWKLLISFYVTWFHKGQKFNVILWKKCRRQSYLWLSWNQIENISLWQKKNKEHSPCYKRCAICFDFFKHFIYWIRYQKNPLVSYHTQALTGKMKERVSKLTYPTLQHCLRMLYEWQFQALVTGNWRKKGI